jgi:hypothetical protein
MMVDGMGAWWLGDFGATVRNGDVIEETTECKAVRGDMLTCSTTQDPTLFVSGFAPLYTMNSNAKFQYDW